MKNRVRLKYFVNDCRLKDQNHFLLKGTSFELWYFACFMNYLTDYTRFLKFEWRTIFYSPCFHLSTLMIMVLNGLPMKELLVTTDHKNIQQLAIKMFKEVMVCLLNLCDICSQRVDKYFTRNSYHPDENCISCISSLSKQKTKTFEISPLELELNIYLSMVKEPIKSIELIRSFDSPCRLRTT